MNLAIYVLFLHFLADFVFQTDWMAKNKSKDWFVLYTHIMVYGFVVGIPLLFVSDYLSVVKFAALNAAVHFCVDAVTSRVNSRLYASGRIHAFFVGIGADQFVHAATLLLTLPLLGVR